MKEIAEVMTNATDAEGGALKLLTARRGQLQPCGAKQEGGRGPRLTGATRRCGVEAGGTIASLLIQGPIRVVGFLPESDLSVVAIGTPGKTFTRPFPCRKPV